jgi:hypothetical protein
MSWNKDNLEKAFAKVKLTLVFAKESFARGVNSEDIFGLDIRRAKPGRADSEYFLMWPGHEDNSIVIRDSDASFGQVVLTITEKEREFEETVDSYGVKRALDRHKGDAAAALKELQGSTVREYPKVKLWAPKKKTLVLLRKTPKDSRTFLLGMDERQLFMTQVNRNITTVAAAHASLKTPTVTFFEGKADGKTIRQGEWFFVNLPTDEMEGLELAIKKNQVSPLKKVPIGNFAGRRGGKPHTADELVVFNFNPITAPITQGENILRREQMMTRSPQPQGRNAIYVRGAVKHLDHETVKFNQWRKVIANTESGISVSVGGGWVD